MKSSLNHHLPSSSSWGQPRPDRRKKCIIKSALLLLTTQQDKKHCLALLFMPIPHHLRHHPLQLVLFLHLDHHHLPHHPHPHHLQGWIISHAIMTFSNIFVLSHEKKFANLLLPLRLPHLLHLPPHHQFLALHSLHSPNHKFWVKSEF